jgi:hypothetical protein
MLLYAGSEVVPGYLMVTMLSPAMGNNKNFCVGASLCESRRGFRALGKTAPRELGEKINGKTACPL